MKKQVLPLVAAVVFTLISTSVMAAPPANENTLNSKASLKVINPIAISEVKDLNFGTMGVGWGGTVNLSPETSQRTAQNAVYLLTDETDHVATYNITGSPNSSYVVTFDESFSVINEADELSVVPSIYIQSKAELNSKVSSLNGEGKDSFNIGGSVSFTDVTNMGEYHGNFNVTVNYN